MCVVRFLFFILIRLLLLLNRIKLLNMRLCNSSSCDVICIYTNFLIKLLLLLYRIKQDCCASIHQCDVIFIHTNFLSDVMM